MNRRPKRVYKTVVVAPDDEAYAVLLDGKPAKIGKAVLRLPSAALAEAVAEEWRDQVDHIDFAAMRLTALAAAALVGVANARGNAVEHILSYGRNELICYRAAEPPELAARQKAEWDVLVDWVGERYAIRLVADRGISFIEQPVDALVRMQEVVSGLDNFALAALNAATTLTSSFVVALAFLAGRLGADEAFAISHLDELYQAEKWGKDAEAEFRRTDIIAALKAVQRFISLRPG